MKKIHQLIGTLTSGDAIGNEALMIKRLLRQWGYESGIYCYYFTKEVSSEVMDFRQLKSTDEDIIIYHYGGLDEIYKHLDAIRGRKVLVYHNITPYTYFSRYEPEYAKILKKSRDKLSEITDKFEYSIVKSNYTKAELDEIGFKNIMVIPVMFDLDKYNVPFKNIDIGNRPEELRMLTIGRVVPNKMLEDLIMVFYHYNKSIDSNGKFVIVGDYGITGSFTYHYMLQKLIKELGLTNIYFSNKVDFQTLLGFYHWANIYITMSRHEGFCVPVVEAMHFGIPVLATNACAIPETLGNSGVLLNNRDFMEIAELVHVVLKDEKLRGQIINGEKERARQFARDRIENMFREFIKEIA